MCELWDVADATPTLKTCSGVDLVNSGLLNMKLVPSKQVESIRQLESVDTYERNLRKLA